jgi:hypothetical protein
LNFPALVAGSLTPDVGYLFPGQKVSDLSHSILGGMVFGFLVGLASILLLYGAGTIVLRRGPNTQFIRENQVWGELRKAVLPKWSTTAVVISLLIGVWTHLILDSFTHSDAWLVIHSEFLRRPIATVAHRTIRVCHLLWYGCSFLGVAYLVFAFGRWPDDQGVGRGGRTKISHVREALIIPLLVLPIEIAHHFIRSRLALIFVVLVSVILVVAVTVGLIGQSGSKNHETDSGILR